MPDGWAWARIIDIATLKSGGQYEICEDEGSYAYVKVADMNNEENQNEIKVSTKRCLCKENELIPINSIIFPKRGGAILTNKKRINIRFPIAVDSNTMAMTPFLGVGLRYLKCWLDSFDLSSLWSGNIVPQINNQDIYPLFIPIPPLAEQLRIAAAIESAFSIIDEIEQAKTDLQAAAAAAKQKILALAISGRLVPQDPSDEPASALLERIRAEREKQAKNGKTKPSKKAKSPAATRDSSHYADIPDSWIWCKLDDIGLTNIGLTYKPADICSDGVPVLRSSNIKKGKLDLTDVIRVSTAFGNNLELQSQDILICARNGSRHLVGKCAIIPEDSERMTFGAFMAVFRSICSQYVYHFLNSDFFRQVFDSEGISTQINQLTQAMIRDTTIPLPPLAEQRRIVAAIEAAFAQLDAIASEVQ